MKIADQSLTTSTTSGFHIQQPEQLTPTFASMSISLSSLTHLKKQGKNYHAALELIRRIPLRLKLV